MKKSYQREHELAAIADAWSNLPPHIKEAILLLVGAKGRARAIATVEKNKAAAVKSKTAAQAIKEMRGDSLHATVDQVAKLIGQNRATIYRYVKLGKIPSVGIGDAIRIPWAVVEGLLTPKASIEATE